MPEASPAPPQPSSARVKQRDEKGSDKADEQTAFAEQYFRDEQQHWKDSYGQDTDDKPPTRGGWIKKDISGTRTTRPHYLRYCYITFISQLHSGMAASISGDGKKVVH
ncbi:hypothetical protein F5Y19DRAFT_471537 [Xylariaceae sp. FL1651]|nr:hypothetical protein F5Y19DRAFT_471537 [Xylariaceae sp. FL1651]